MVEEVKEETQLQDGIDIALLRDQKFTVEEYKEALEQECGSPNPNNCKDVLYYTKFAHNMPPPQAFFVLPRNWDKFCTEDKPNDRLIFYGWNNITEFEEKQIEAMHSNCQELGVPIPETFGKRDVLKFA